MAVPEGDNPLEDLIIICNLCFFKQLFGNLELGLGS
jgi:hypothetical protein